LQHIVHRTSYIVHPYICSPTNNCVAMAKTKTEDTPLMQQHRAIKQKYPDAILLFRVGDFYETFGQDAVLASQILGITLTKRNNGAASSSELAGFPHHALDTYLHKLVKAGYRVAICDQLEDPKTVKGIVKRGVTEMVTPGVATNDKLLEHNSNNFLAAIHFTETETGIAFLDENCGFSRRVDVADLDERTLSLWHPKSAIQAVGLRCGSSRPMRNCSSAGIAWRLDRRRSEMTRSCDRSRIRYGWPIAAAIALAPIVNSKFTLTSLPVLRRPKIAVGG